MQPAIKYFWWPFFIRMLILLAVKGGEKDENLQNSLDSCFDGNDVYCLDGGFQVPLVGCGR